MLDGDLACHGLASRFGDLCIYWGAQLGLPDESLISGRLSEVIEEIRAARAAIRNARGWVMDTYLLRPPE
jgi:precorrin-6A synthase